ncbi:MAG TPA: polysaccharide deacetylase family protein [Rhodocyclaceae bacterium]
MAKRALPVLMYHHVSPVPGLVTMSLAVFRSQMQWLAEQGWTTLGAQGLADFYAGKPIPDKSLVLSFDDGYLDNFLHAHPVLQELGLRALLFVVTGWLGDGPPRSGTAECLSHSECKRRIGAGQADDVVLRWSEVEAMHTAGSFEFHSHTDTHTRWDKQLPPGAARRAAMAEELAQSRATLVQRLGECSRHLCWPQGYFEPDYVELAAAAGFDHLYTTQRLINLPGGDTRRIGRLAVKEKPGAWLGRRLGLYASPFWGGLYLRLRGR